MNPPDPMTRLATSLYQIATRLVTDRSLSAGLHEAARLAERTIPGCDACTISLIVEGRPRTVAATDRAVVQLDLVQYEHDDGPCLDSARQGDVVSIEFWPIDERYQHFANAARDGAFTAVVSVPVLLSGATASINLYSRPPGGFPIDPLPPGRLVAAQVAIALRGSELVHEVTELTAGLQLEGERRTTLAQAQGALVTLYECTLEQARALLEQASQDEARTVDEVAELVLSSLPDRTGSSNGPTPTASRPWNTTDSVHFGGLQIEFDDSVLRPRAWTLEQSEWAAEISPSVGSGRILELCSGVGHIGLEAARLSGRSLMQVDASAAACRFAVWNALAAGLAARCEVHRGDLRGLDLGAERFPLVLADPPYLRSDELRRFPADPLSAVDGGISGLDLLIESLLVIDAVLDRDGIALVQLRGPSQADVLAAHLPSGLVVSEVRAHDEERALISVARPPA